MFFLAGQQTLVPAEVMAAAIVANQYIEGGAT
jgi:hypothetical protein